MTDVCRSCKAPILWAKTENGRLIPLDPEPDAAGNVALVDGVAVVLTARVLERIRGATLHRSHFATCPYADDHRRPR